MKKANRQILCLLLFAAMMITMLPAAAYAADTALGTELVTNGGAESDAIAGWTDDTGQGRWNSSTVFSDWAAPAEGSKYFYLYNPSMDNPLSGTMSQWIALSGTEGSGLLADISAGNISMQFSICMFQNISADNEAKAIVEQYSSGGALLKTSQAVNTTFSGAMTLCRINTQVDPAARKFKVILSATLTKGGYAQFDGISLKLVNVSSGSAPVFGNDFPVSAETDAGAAYTADFTISDADAGDVDKLTFSASSTNINLIPATNVTFGGSGGNMTLRVMPAGNLSGEADITVTASDGAKSADKTFHFIVHRIISMDTNLVENGDGAGGLAGWYGNTINIKTTDGGFTTDSPGSYMSQNMDISKFSPLIDGGETTYALSATLPNQASQSGKISVQFYTDIACTNPVGSPFGTTSFPVPNQQIPAGAKGATITFSDVSSLYVDVPVKNISFKIVNDFPKISAIGDKTTDLGPLTIPVYAYYATPSATLTAASGDQAVVPDGGITASGSGYNRSISFTPLKNGTTVITLTLNDGSKSVSVHFNVAAHEPARVTGIDPPAAGFCAAGGDLDFTVHFSYPVAGGTGSFLPLTIGGTDASANYLSSTESSITYRYTIGSSDSGAVTIGPAIDDTSSPITGPGYDVETGISGGDTGVTVVRAPEVTSTADSSAAYGTKITFTATLNCTKSLSGTIQFAANGSDLGATAAVGGNAASYETSETQLAAGTASITAKFIPTGSNYNFAGLTSNAYTINIARRPITITPDPATKVLGDGDPKLSYKITAGSLAGSDTLAGGPARNSGEDIGEYEITQGSLTNDNNPNYDITFVPGVKLTIAAVPVTMESISVKDHPAKTAYTEGEKLDLSGLVITLHNSDGSTPDIALSGFAANGITTAPADGDTLSTADTKVTITHTASGKSTEQAITVTAATYGISLSQSGQYTFPAQNEGYDPVTPLTVTVSNTDNQKTGGLNVALSGRDADSFNLSADTIDSIAAGEDGTFTVAPGDGLTSGTYKATVTVSGSNVTGKSFTISFTVNGMTPTGYDITIENDGNGTGIAIPSSAASDTEITLTATPNDGYHFKEWQVVSPDGLSITGNTFIMPDEDVSIMAVFEQNTEEGHSITILDDGHGSADSSVSYAKAGRIVTLSYSPDSGFKFKEWRVVSPEDLVIEDDSFIMPNEGVTIKALFKEKSTGGNKSSKKKEESTTSFTIAPEKRPGQPVTVIIPITADKTGDISIKDKTFSDALSWALSYARAQGRIANGTAVRLDVTGTVLSIPLTKDALSTLVDAGIKDIEINGLQVGLSLDLRALNTLMQYGDCRLNISEVNKNDLNNDANEMIGNRPAYNISVSYIKDGKEVNIHDLEGGKVTISIPYTPAENESLDYLFGVYVDDNGNASRIDDSFYDEESGCIISVTDHLSVYGVGYAAPSDKFTDISGHWAKEYIEYAVDKGLLTGISGTAFSPDSPMTRGMLVTALGRLSKIDEDDYTMSSFTDVDNSSRYMPYIEWAYGRSIIKGIGNNEFAPDREITREQIAVIFANYAKTAGYTLPVTHDETTFTDENSIGSIYRDAVKAMQLSGIMRGSGNMFYPKSGATRAEVSAMLTRYILLITDTVAVQ